MRALDLLVAFVLLTVALSGCTQAPVDPHVPGGLGCPDSGPTQPLPPEQHRVQRIEDLQCAGQYVVIREGDGARWEDPVWSSGDEWMFQIVMFSDEGPICVQERSEVVVGSGTDQGVEVYNLEAVSYLDCEGTPHPGGPSDYNRTRDSLAILREDGYIHRETLFPLVDGKQWAYVNSNGHFVEATVRYIPDYEHHGNSTEAWQIRMEGQLTVYQVWGPEAGAMLYEERWNEDTLVNGRILASYQRS